MPRVRVPHLLAQLDVNYFNYAARSGALAPHAARRQLLLLCHVSRVTPDFPKKTKCISYVRQDQVYTHMIDVMSEISINNNKNIQELHHYIIFYYTQTIDSKVFKTNKR
jgi:hypothetical protein